MIIVAGVSGSGKSTIGRLLADRLGRRFLDADDLHTPENVAKMNAGVPLNDNDRRPWLDAVGAAAAAHSPCVVACSALKRSHRDRVRIHYPEALTVQLEAPTTEIAERLTERANHFMNPALLASQINTLEQLEKDEVGFIIHAVADPTDLMDNILEQLL